MILTISRCIVPLDGSVFPLDKPAITDLTVRVDFLLILKRFLFVVFRLKSVVKNIFVYDSDRRFHSLVGKHYHVGSAGVAFYLYFLVLLR